MRSFVVAAVFLGSLIACGSSTTGTGGGATQKLDGENFCTRAVDECQAMDLTKAECIETFGMLRLSKACVDGFTEASCEELASDESDLSDVCFPPCEGEDPSCDGDRVTLCTDDGKTLVADCADVCATQDKEYAGTCGTSYNGQPSSDGKAKCFCK